MSTESSRGAATATGENILPGTCYDWRGPPRRVAGYRADAGQLLWSTESGSSERALAVLVDGVPIEVMEVSGNENPRRLKLYFRPIGSKQQEPFPRAVVELAALFEQFLLYSERIDATPEE